ncbi:putative lipase 1 [[Candida] railenensis]|uniref:Lipase 1 n=1 Tax=[Candida] railenensis TaxID=45579 RepID=A0A9P0QTP1_9ASCO|nr:putative lipase 1 [[Candida] railenensis]
MKFFHLLFLSVFLSLIDAAPTSDLQARGFPVKPSDDPFYQPPSGYEDKPLGTILRIRKQTNAYGIIIFQAKVESVYQILVRSEDSFNQPIAVMSTLFVPYNADPSKLLSYQVAQDSSCPDCAPSYAMQLWTNPLTWVTAQIEQLLLLAAFEQGYYVVVPDHEGPKSAFIAGWSAGKAVLNTIRAALSSGSTTGVNSDADVVIWGYSGGAHATAWTSQLHPSYAPELNILGAAMGGIPVNVTHVALNNMGTIWAGFIFTAINGLSHEYPELGEFVKEKVYPSKYKQFTNTDNLCLIETIPLYLFQTWDDYLEEGSDVLYDPIVKNVTDAQNLLTTGNIPDIPTFIYSSENDEIIPIDDTDSLYELYCSKGVSVELRKDTFSEHIIAAVSGAGLAFNFVKDRFDGVPVNPQCQTSTSLSNIFDPTSLDGLGSLVKGILLTLIGSKLGPDNQVITSSNSTDDVLSSYGLRR